MPVISVGNISAGGTGKTPIVEMLIKKLEVNYRLSVISRGYGRKSSGTIIVSDGNGKFASVEKAGDEPSQLAQKFPKQIIVVDEKRARGAQKAIELGANLILMDDGFQHRYLHRDLDIVVVAAQEILNGDWLLPAGNRREPISSLKRADLIVISRCRSEADFIQTEQKLKSLNKPIIGARTKLKKFKQLTSKEIVESNFLKNKNAIVVSGIGNPKSFESLLINSGIRVLEHLVFPDHHWYSESDMKRIAESKKLLNADLVITTEKDAVRLEKILTQDLVDVVIAEIEQEVIAGKDVLEKALRGISS